MLIQRPIVKAATETAIAVSLAMVFVFIFVGCVQIRETLKIYHQFLILFGVCVLLPFPFVYFGQVKENSKYDLYLEENYLILRKANSLEELTRIYLHLAGSFRCRRQFPFVGTVLVHVSIGASHYYDKSPLDICFSPFSGNRISWFN
jgi:hypothetical protein